MLCCCSLWLAKVIPIFSVSVHDTNSSLKKSLEVYYAFRREKRAEREKNLRENSFENFKWPCVVTSDLASEINEFPSCQNVN